jgi:hypothetical protein
MLASTTERIDLWRPLRVTCLDIIMLLTLCCNRNVLLDLRNPFRHGRVRFM